MQLEKEKAVETEVNIPQLIVSGNQKPGNAAVDPFDLNSLRVGQDFASMVGVKKSLLTVPVRKPHRQEFFRVHPSEDYQLSTAIIEAKDDREIYLVHWQLRDGLPEFTKLVTLLAVINRQGVVSLWPIGLPGVDGRQNSWNTSAFAVAKVAQEKWVRMEANMSLGGYQAYVATGKLAEPEWPEEDFQTLVSLAFKDRFIQSSDHPLLRRLRGEL